jgi:DNA-binding Xre family transcriptional regulator
MLVLRIKEICKDKKITLNELSKKIGVSQPSISGLATGKLKPSFDTLERLINALEVSPGDLFEKPADESPTGVCPHCGKPIRIHFDK